MKQIFISYVNKDQKIAEKLYYDLSKAGLKPWMDKKNLLPGQNWKVIIHQAIKNSSYFLALLSSNSVSKRGFIHKELKIALEILDEFPVSDVFIIPVRLDECKPTNEKLQELNWVDLFPSYKVGLKKILKVFFLNIIQNS